jgi:hypothetical protein
VQFSYEDVWQDALGLARSHRETLGAILGVFIFLPMLAQGLFLEFPEIKSLDWNGIKLMQDFYIENRWALLGVRILTLLGAGALIALLVRSEGLTAGQAIMAAFKLLPGLFFLSIIVSFAVFTGMAVLLIPGFYLLGRLALAEPAMVAEQKINPLTAIQRSFILTDKQGWRVFGLLAIVILVAWLAVQVVAMLAGIAGALTLSDGGLKILSSILGAVSACVFTLSTAIVSAALYRQLTGSYKGT